MMDGNHYRENIIILSTFGLFFGIIVFFYADSTPNDVYGMIYISPIIVCIALSLALAKRYKKTRNFSYGFMFVGLSHLSLLLAELLWLAMPYFELPQYESYPDIFYLGYVTCSLIFPWFILRHYKIRLTLTQYLLILLITIIGVSSYLALSYGVWDSSSTFGLGFVFALLTSVLAGVSIITMSALKNTKIFTVWTIIVFSFLISAIADIGYYASENTTDWGPGDWFNIIWFVSYLIMIFALSEQNYSYIIKRKE